MTRAMVHRTGAVAEVLLAFVVMHAAFRACKRFTPWGAIESATDVHVSIGAALVGVAAAMIALRRRGKPWSTVMAENGLTLRPFHRGVRAALVCQLVLIAFGAAVLAAGAPLRARVLEPRHAIVQALLLLVASAVMLWILARWAAAIDRLPRILSAAWLAAVFGVPAVMVLASDRARGPTVLSLLSVVVNAAIAEEVFFRGYAQSRLDAAFGRPWQFLGVPFGPGLVLASLLFGAVHVLNTTDYFAGTYRFAWCWGLVTAASVHYGFLRAKTGSVLAPILVHATTDLIARTPGLLPGG
jgi:membrane protease YdiL (CAAX protease family)